MTNPDASYGSITICGVFEARSKWKEFDAVITIEDPDDPFPLRVDENSRVEHHVAKFHDTDRIMSRLTAPSRPVLRKTMEFARRFPDKNILIHCAMGVSRSPAVALGVIADRLGPGKEKEAVDELFRIAPECEPNMRVVEIMDDLVCERENSGNLLFPFIERIEKRRKEDAKRPSKWISF